MPNTSYGSIPHIDGSQENLIEAVRALKQAVEVLIRQRKPVESGAVTWQDLLDLELIEREQLPLR